jgi:hypothetical protein
MKIDIGAYAILDALGLQFLLNGLDFVVER